MSTLWIVLIIAAVIILYVIYVFNSMITLKNRVQNSWGQIDVQLKRRYDLIPNLVETVKGYAKHEKETLDMVTKARAGLMKGGMQERAKASDMITNALKSLFAVAESYPDLKANQNFLMLQEELAGTESKIAYARQFYNDMVMKFNTKLEKFPTNMVGKMLNFASKEYFKTEGVEREAVKVKF
ncbi:LemA family protein [Candidatus Woesearchaeota archaeon]|nr:LemA family protein [Candidatus Woesearchaeota archaeon]